MAGMELRVRRIERQVANARQRQDYAPLPDTAVGTFLRTVGSEGVRGLLRGIAERGRQLVPRVDD